MGRIVRFARFHGRTATATTLALSIVRAKPHRSPNERYRVVVPNRLGMKDWIVLETQEDAYNMRVVAGKPVQPEVCPRCGVENPRVYKHDQQDQTFMDTPMHGKRVGIQVVRQRWRDSGGGGGAS